MTEPLLSVSGLSVRYGRTGLWVKAPVAFAVRDVSFDLASGECLGIVGESGSGKSTIAKALTQLVKPAAGSARFEQHDLFTAANSANRARRRRIQMVFQDPVGSLDPRMTVRQIILEPVRNLEPDTSAAERTARVDAMLQSVGLGPEHGARTPQQLSGGQAQRVAIARSLIVRPRLLICDEPLSALDVSVKAQVANLLKDLQQQQQLSMLLISHDLGAVRFSCDRVIVLYLGRIMEMATTSELFTRPQHPYTRALLRAVPGVHPGINARTRAPLLHGEMPSTVDQPTGCVFHTRCPHAQEQCRQQVPQLLPTAHGAVACLRSGELSQTD